VEAAGTTAEGHAGTAEGDADTTTEEGEVMTDQEERAANELVGFLTAAVVYPNVAVEVRKPLLALASKALKHSEGTPHDDLQLAVGNLKAL
jgi:hypothetical protein